MSKYLGTITDSNDIATKGYIDDTIGDVDEVIDDINDLIAARGTPQTVILQVPDGATTTAKIADGAVTTAKLAAGTMVNPNLLDNWYFGNPVNQRGVTSKTLANNEYCVDRWYSMAANMPISVTTSGLSFDSTVANAGLIQKIEKPTIFSGRTVTLSFFIPALSGTISVAYAHNESGSYTQVNVGEIAAAGVASFTFTLPTLSNATYLAVRFYAKTGVQTAYTVLAVKLELGSVQTLAHQENGVWVLNEIPDYGEQLRRCQRYFYTIKNITGAGLPLAGHCTSSSTEVDTSISLPIPMRTAPSISGSSAIAIRGINGYSTDASTSPTYRQAIISMIFDPYRIQQNLIFRKSDGSAWGGLTNNTPCVVTFYAGTSLNFSADL